MTNGTPCKIKKFDYRVEHSSRCSFVLVAVDAPSVGMQCRQKYRHLFNKEVCGDWTPILETTRSFSMQYFKTYYIVRRLFPIQIAGAKTIHKAQGSTPNGAIVHFGFRRNEHIHYVGLSRVRNLNALHILELNEGKMSVPKSVLNEMNGLEMNAKQLCVCLV